ncbi:MAG: HD-GYP domain-containing protein [Gemmatimonadota bacterium]
MSLPVRFLTGMAQAISTMALYQEGHPARERGVDRAYQALADLQDETPRPHFTFLGDDILMDRRPLRELRQWDWGPRLAGAGIQRMELLGPVTRDDLEAFLEEVHTRLSDAPTSSAGVRQGRPTNIRYGTVSVAGQETLPGSSGTELATATLSYSLREEVEGVTWLQDELKEGRKLQMLEAEGIVRSLSVAMHGDQAYLIPLLRLKEFDQYTVTHTLNVAVLTMALAEFLGMSPREVRAFGIAGLLHDLGKVTVPNEILNKPGKLTEDERQIMNAHPVEGARLILAAEENLDLAAVVAYEHHIRIDGGGYPSLSYPRPCHEASNLVHVCDVFDALRTHRPYREAWPAERALKIIEEGAGPEFDADVAAAFVQMMRRWESRVAESGIDDPRVPAQPGEEGEGGAVGSDGARTSAEALGDAPDIEDMTWE